YMHDVWVNRPNFTPRFSKGRSQPFAAFETVRQHTEDLGGGGPAHTFFRKNDNYRQSSSADAPFDWFVHLDRQLISPMELLYVPACKPHELTHRFISGPTAAQKFNHMAPWLDEDFAEESPREHSHRLYRALELFTTGSQLAGMRSVEITLQLKKDIVPGVRTTVTIPPDEMRSLLSGGTWQIEVGSTLAIDKGAVTEDVVRV